MTGRRDGAGSGMTKGGSILSGLSLNMGALRASSQKEECQESVAVLGHKKGHLPRTGQKRLEKLRFQVTFPESSLGSWEPLLILELG